MNIQFPSSVVIWFWIPNEFMHEVNGCFWLFSTSFLRYLFTISYALACVCILTIFLISLFPIEDIRLYMYCLFNTTQKRNLETLLSFELVWVLVILYYSKITKCMRVIVRYRTFYKNKINLKHSKFFYMEL